MSRFLWLGVLWPVLLFALPNVYDDPVREYGAVVHAADTTYGDGRYAALVPGVTDTLVQGGSDTLIRFRPDPDSLGADGLAYIAIRKPAGDSFLVLSYDTLAVAALDSAAVDSIWSAWGLGTPYAYAISVPGAPDAVQPAWEIDYGTDYTNTADYYANAESDFPGFAILQDSIFDNPGKDVRNFIDQTQGYSGATRSLRVEYEGVGTDTCVYEQGAGSAIEWSGAFFDSIGVRYSDRIWVEYTMKFDTTWETNVGTGGDPPDCDPYGDGHKLLRVVLGDTLGKTGEFSTKDGVFPANLWTHDPPPKADESEYSNVTSIPDSFWVKSGRWHVVRIGGVRSSTKGASDGYWWGTIDSLGTWIDFAPTSIGDGDSLDIWWYMIAPPGNAARIPMNRNRAAPVTQGLNIARIRFYDEFPGWDGHPVPDR